MENNKLCKFVVDEIWWDVVGIYEVLVFVKILFVLYVCVFECVNDEVKKKIWNEKLFDEYINLGKMWREARFSQ